MTSGALRPERYDARGGTQPMLGCGPSTGPQVLIIPPLFGEMNRTRRLLADVMRALAADGVGSWLPDLPGTGESPTPLVETGWEQWREAIDAAALVASACGPLVVASVRGGALLDGIEAAIGWWRLAPANGATLLRDLLRIRQMADAEEGAKPELATLQARLENEIVELAGYRISPALARGLAHLEPSPREPLRTLTLGETPDPEAGVLAGPRLWRRAEPGSSRSLALALADDITAWARTCASV